MKKSMLFMVAFALCIVVFAGCSQTELNNDENSSTEGTGGIPPLSDWDWCTHTLEERLWIHTIPGSMNTYVGDKAYKAYQEYCVTLANEKSVDAPTIIDFLRFQQLSPSEVSSLLDQVNADCLLVNSPETYNDKAKSKIFKELFGYDSNEIEKVSKVDVYYKVKEGTRQGLIFGTESVDDIATSGGTADNSLPYGVVGYVGIKNYNLWVTNLKDKKTYSIQNFLKDFNVPVDIYDDAIYYTSLEPNSIYTQELYDKVRKEIYGSTKKIEEVPVVSSEETVVSKFSSEWAEYYSSKAASQAVVDAAKAASSIQTTTPNLSSSK